MKFLKRNKKIIIGILIGAILAGGIVYAATSADKVTYTTNKNIEVKNVEEALNDLYNNKKETSDESKSITSNGEQTLDKYYKYINVNVENNQTEIINKPVLLWTNSSPSSSFAAQTISLDLSSYKYVIVVTNDSTSNQTQHSYGIVPIGLDYNVGMARNCGSTVRTFRATSSSVIIQNAMYATSTFNGECVPYKIYGVSGDLEI